MQKAIQVHADDAEDFWDVAEPYIQKVIDTTDIKEYKAPHVLKRVQEKKLSLFLILDTDTKEVTGAYTMSFMDYPERKTATIVHFSADDMQCAIDCWAQMTDHAKENGAKCLNIYGRKGWWRIAKEYGFRQVLVQYEREI